LSRQKLKKQLKQKNPQLNESELQFIIDSFTDIINQALLKRQECEIRDFGSFRFNKLKANANLRNPLTNELIYRPERVKLKFKASKKLNKLINE
jgi:nucleoid DNA-binding protein